MVQSDLDLTYNDNGELTQKRDRTTGDTVSLGYSTLGDLTSATTSDGRQINYLLDGAGRRVGKKVDGALTEGLLYAPGASGPAAELDGENNLAARFIYATNANVPDYMVKDGTTYRVITDQLGSVVMVANANTGAIAQELTYGPFGEVLTDSNPGFQPFGFAGGIYDTDTGLVHFGAREYDTELGRWTASDPIGFGGGDSDLYGYVLGDPVNFTDPSGLYVDGQPQHWAEPVPSSPGMQGVCKTFSAIFGIGGSYTVCTWTDAQGNVHVTKTYDVNLGTPDASYTNGLAQTNADSVSQLCGGFPTIGVGAGVGAGAAGNAAAGHDANGNPIIVNSTGPSIGLPPGASASVGYGWTTADSCECE